MSVIIAIPLLGALLILQTAVLSNVLLLQGTVDLILLTVIAWALQLQVRTAWQWGVIGGLMVSFVSGLPYFIPLISYLAAVGLALVLRKRVWQVPILAMFVTTFAGTLLMHGLTVLGLRIEGIVISPLKALETITIPSLFLNLLASIPVFVLLGELADRLYPEELEV
jgi:hypothetical protein